MTCSRDLRRLGLVAALVASTPLRADAGEARALVEQSRAALTHGRYAAARALAVQAVKAQPDQGDARVVLAQAALGEGDGITAEAELGKARERGFDMKGGRQLMAHARLLQGDPTRALAEAKTADAAHWTYGLRIQAKALAAMGNPGAADDMLGLALARSPGDAALWVDVGRFRQDIGDTAGAITAAERAVTIDRDNADALLLRAQLVRGQYGLAASLPWFEAALKRDPASYAVLIDYAATLGDAGRATAMLAMTRRALAARPGDPHAIYLLAVLAARAGNTDLARDLLEKTGDALAGMPGPLLLGATLDISGGDYEQAVAKLRNLIGIQPLNIQARQLLAVALIGGDAARDALDVLRPIAMRDDADSYTLTLAARAFERVGERAMAAQMLDRAAHPGRGGSASFGSDDSIAVLDAGAAGDPAGEPATAIPLIRGLLDDGNTGAALARAQAVASANPGSPAAAIVLGDTLMMLARPADAARSYTRAADLRFDEPTMLRLTEARDAAGDHAGAANALALFLSQNPGNVAASRLAAHWQIAGRHYDAAIDTLEALRARIGNRDAALLAELAFAYDGAGNADVARSFAAAAYRLSPSNAAAADAYGWSLYGTGDADGALQLLEKAVTIAPEHAGLRWHLAQLYAGLGRKRDASAQAAVALRDPRFGERAAAQALLSALG